MKKRKGDSSYRGGGGPKYYEQQNDSDEEDCSGGTGNLSYEATCVKLRRSVIMIIAINRMKKLATKQSSTCLDEEDIHKCVTTITSHKSTQPLNAEMTEALF